MLIDRLPSMGGSHYISARRNDPDLAEQLLDLADALPDGHTLPPWRPADAEWTQQDELLTKVFDRLGDVVALLADQPLPKGTKRHKPPAHHARPLRAVDVARARRRNRYLAELDDEVEAAKARWRAQQGATDN